MNVNIEEKPKYEFRHAHEILPPHHLDKLGRDARKVYTSVWNVCNSRKLDWCWLRDEELIRRARIRPDLLPTLQSELSRSGLMHIVPGVAQIKYVVIDPDGEVTEIQD
jgi:hypothetical protein